MLQPDPRALRSIGMSTCTGVSSGIGKGAEDYGGP